MNKIIKIGRIKIAIILFLFLFSCSSNQDGIQGVCRHKAIYAALIYSEKYPVRLVSGKCRYKKCNHVQAQYYNENGDWQWLVVKNDTVYKGKKDYWFMPPYIYRSLPEYLYFWQ